MKNIITIGMKDMVMAMELINDDKSYFDFCFRVGQVSFCRVKEQKTSFPRVYLHNYFFPSRDCRFH